MRVVVQRVSRAKVTAAGDVVGEIGPGLLALAGFAPGDDEVKIRWMADKLAGLRIFSDERGRMNRSVVDAGGEVLVVSQFTLYGDATKGRRPSFARAAPPEVAVRLYESFVAALGRRLPRPVRTGRFGAAMEVALVADGPVTLLVER